MRDPKREDRRYERLGYQITLLDHIAGPGWRGTVDLTGLSVRLAAEEWGETLVVLRGYDEEGTPVVAFHSAVGPSEALAGAMTRMQAGTLKWKVDEYAKGR